MVKKWFLTFVELIIFIFLFSGAAFSEVLTLSKVVNIAVHNNYLIKMQEENIKAAKFKYLSSVSAMFPKLDLSYSYIHMKDEPYTVVMGEKMVVGKRDRVKWFLRVMQPIFTGFALSTEKEIAKLGISLSRIYKREAVLDVALDAKVAYFNVLLAQKKLMVAREAVRQLRSHLKDAEQFYKEQMIPLNDLLKSKVALAGAIQNEVKAKNYLKVVRSMLNIVLSRKIDSSFKLKDVNSIEPMNTQSISNLYFKAINNRPVISVLKLQMEQENLNAKLAKSNYYPHVSVFAEYQQDGGDVFADKNDFSNQHNTIIGLQLSWRIFDSFKTHYDIEEAYHKVFALREKFKNLEQKIKLSVKEAYLNLKTAIENIHTAKVALKEAKENYRITTVRYKNQLATSTDVLDARTYLTQAEMNYYDALYGYYIARARLERAIGEY